MSHCHYFDLGRIHLLHVIGVNWSMLGGGGQKCPKIGPHGLSMAPNTYMYFADVWQVYLQDFVDK